MQYQYTSSDIQRFNNKIKIAPSGCHEWQAVANSNGYGQFNIGGKMMYAHRVAWEIANGPIPTGMCILHRCDNPCCCNPAHLFLGTQEDNALDSSEKGRRGRLKGEDNPRAKLTEEDVIKIREIYAGGNRTQEQLASAFLVSQRLISSIVRRELWKHI